MSRILIAKLFSISAGFSAALFSLVLFEVLLLLPDLNVLLPGLDPVLLWGSLAEELTRWLGIYALMLLVIEKIENRQIIGYFFLFGIGFAAFEFFLVQLGPTNLAFKETALHYFPALCLHLLNTFLIGTSFVAGKALTPKYYLAIPLIFLFLSVIIHLVFNLSIVAAWK